MKAPFDIFGNLVLVKFKPGTKIKDKRRFANKLLRDNKAVKTILEKTGKFTGRLRKQKTKWLAGEKTKEALYKENGCVFRFNIDSVYFSPRLSNERKEIAQKIKKGDLVLVMFAGVGPYGIVIAKKSRTGKVVSIEINKEASKYAKMNLGLNRVKGKFEVIQGDVKKVSLKLKKAKKKFDVIVMPRPQLKDSFLKEAFMLSKKGTRIFYYDFCKHDEIKGVINRIESEAKKNRIKIKILKIKKAGEIAPYKYRIRVDFKLL